MNLVLKSKVYKVESPGFVDFMTLWTFNLLLTSSSHQYSHLMED